MTAELVKVFTRLLCGESNIPNTFKPPSHVVFLHPFLLGKEGKERGGDGEEGGGGVVSILFFN